MGEDFMLRETLKDMENGLVVEGLGGRKNQNQIIKKNDTLLIIFSILPYNYNHLKFFTKIQKHFQNLNFLIHISNTNANKLDF